MRHWKNATVKAVIGRVNTCECEAVGDNKTEEQRTVFGRAEAEKARQFHQSFPEYAPTPLVSLDNLSELLGVKSIHVKDESYRFGLNAFKGLGGSYCIGNYVAQKLGMDIADMTYEYLTSSEVKEKLGKLTYKHKKNHHYSRERWKPWSWDRMDSESTRTGMCGPDAKGKRQRAFGEYSCVRSGILDHGCKLR